MLPPEIGLAVFAVVVAKRLPLVLFPDAGDACRHPELRQALIAYEELNRNHLLRLEELHPSAFSLSAPGLHPRLQVALENWDDLTRAVGGAESEGDGRDVELLRVARDIKRVETEMVGLASRQAASRGLTKAARLLQQLRTEDEEAGQHLRSLSRRLPKPGASATAALAPPEPEFSAA
jgi:hypothetical protein